MRPVEAKGFAGDVFPNFEEERKRRRQRPPRETYRPGVVWGMPVEVLECRRLFASAVLSGNVLTVTGDADADSIIVYRTTSDAKIRVKVDGTVIPTGGSFNVSSVNSIVVNAGSGEDTVTIERNSLFNEGDTGVNKPTQLNGGDNNDVLNGGDNNDTIRGNAGDDTLRGFESDDTLYGGYGGEDRLEGGDNNDLMYGGDAGAGGNDEVEPDELLGGSGNDTMYGEGGGDDMFGEGGNDRMYGGEGPDLLDPSTGTDVAYGDGGNDTFQGSSDLFNDILDGGTGTDVLGDTDAGDFVNNFP